MVETPEFDLRPANDGWILLRLCRLERDTTEYLESYREEAKSLLILGLGGGALYTSWPR